MTQEAANEWIITEIEQLINYFKKLQSKDAVLIRYYRRSDRNPGAVNPKIVKIYVIKLQFGHFFIIIMPPWNIGNKFYFGEIRNDK